MLGSAYLCVRDYAAPDPELGGGGPALDGWTSTPQAGGWYTLRSADDPALLAAWRANTSGPRVLWALFGPADVLAALATVEPACMPAREAWRRRDEPAVWAWLRRWPTWRVDGTRDGEPVVGERAVLHAEGGQLAAKVPPWAAADLAVTSLLRPALLVTLAGLALDQTLEDEPDRNP